VEEIIGNKLSIDVAPPIVEEIMEIKEAKVNEATEKM
jgi:hypothetical protein